MREERHRARKSRQRQPQTREGQRRPKEGEGADEGRGRVEKGEVGLLRIVSCNLPLMNMRQHNCIHASGLN